MLNSIFNENPELPIIVCLLSASLASPLISQALPVGVKHVQTLDGIEEYRLSSNGLGILLMPNEGSVATVMVTYKVARNESGHDETTYS